MGNDRPWKDGPAGIRSISIHVPSWGTTDSLCGQCDQYRISIHVPSWGTTQTDITLWIYIQNFNPRSLVGNDDGVRIVGVCISNFNPRSLVGNDGVSTETDYLKSISIHVPSWGTTYLYISLYIYSHISIHVPSWGTTQTVRIRAPVKHISIHVPSWGTTAVRFSFSAISVFQSTFPRGERPGAFFRRRTAPLFQSTFPRGERRYLQRTASSCKNFNPRSLVGNDPVALPSLCAGQRFQSTFPRGERR